MASSPVARKSTGTEPNAWTASEWTGTPAPVRQFDDLRDGLDGADLVVGPHHRDQGDRRRVPGELRRQHGQVHDAVRVHRQPATLGTLVPLEPFDGVQHGVVFDGGAQDAGTGAGSRRAGPSTGP